MDLGALQDLYIMTSLYSKIYFQQTGCMLDLPLKQEKVLIKDIGK